mmetsp:Transcript_82667/g.181722  ORF Transcript_82667/g.181722 Transcript_82667/m.181722 type:complete len:116 (+) Transcript_82667:102-449(+)
MSCDELDGDHGGSGSDGALASASSGLCAVGTSTDTPALTGSIGVGRVSHGSSSKGVQFDRDYPERSSNLARVPGIMMKEIRSTLKNNTSFITGEDISIASEWPTWRHVVCVPSQL